MIEKKKIAITGANGHLGYHVCRLLLHEKCYKLRAIVRNNEGKGSLETLGCKDIRIADMTKPSELEAALEGVDALLHLAAVYKHWSVYPEQEIVEANLKGAMNALDGVTKAGVKRLVYISSLTTVSRKENASKALYATGWNSASDTGGNNPYVTSKVQAERYLLEEGVKRGVQVLSLLPSTMIGDIPPQRHMTLSMQFFHKLITKGLPIDPELSLFVVPVTDVARAVVASIKKGNTGGRYILSCENPITTTRLLHIAARLNPAISKGIHLSSSVLYGLASCMEWWGSFSGVEPLLLKSQLDLYHKKRRMVDCSLARTDLGFLAGDAEKAVESCFSALLKQEGE